MSEVFEIFNDENGRVLDRLYRSMNAYGRAQGFADRLGVVVGCGSNPRNVRMYKPSVSKLWIALEDRIPCDCDSEGVTRLASGPNDPIAYAFKCSRCGHEELDAHY